MKILGACSLLCEQNHLDFTPDLMNSSLSARYSKKITGGQLAKISPKKYLNERTT